VALMPDTHYFVCGRCGHVEPADAWTNETGCGNCHYQYGSWFDELDAAEYQSEQVIEEASPKGDPHDAIDAI
jgi:hypothetical protein